MKRLFNYRPILFSLLFFAAGIYCGFVGIKYGKPYALIIFLPVIIFTLTVLISYFIGGKNPQNRVYLLFKGKKLLGFLFLFTLSGYLLFGFTVNRLDRYAVIDGQAAAVSGEISEYKSKEGGGYYILEKATLTAENVTLYENRVFVYVYSDDALPENGRISFTSKLVSNRIFYEGGINSYSYRNGIKYSFYINKEDISLSEGNPSLFLRIRTRIRSVLTENLREENANISYALVTGNCLFMDEDLRNDFSDTGIAHVFSVSGLHIGVLSLCVVFLLNMLKVRKIYQVFIALIVFLFYGAVCNFSPSVTRAIIMSEAYLISVASGRKYDSLTSFSAAAFVILVISPLMLFDRGFLLSFGAVLGIFLLYGKIKLRLRFLPKGIASSVALSLSAQLGILPLSAAFFNKLPIISVLLNVAVIPAVSLMYVLLLALIILTLVLPFLSVLFVLPQGIAEFVKLAVRAAASSGFSYVYANGFGIGAAIFYLFAVTASRYVLLKKRIKLVVCLLLLTVFSCVAVFYNIPLQYNGTAVSALRLAKIKASLITCGKKHYYIDYGSTANNLSELKAYLKSNNIYGIEAAFFTEYNTAAKYIGELEGLGAKKFILPYGWTFTDTFSDYEKANKIKYLLSDEIYTYENIEFSAYYFNNKYYGGRVSAGGLAALFIDKASEAEIKDVYTRNFGFNADIVFADGVMDGIKTFLNPKITVTAEYCLQEDNIYSTARYGSLIFDVNNDKIIRKYRYV